MAQEKIKIDADKIVSVDEVFDILKKQTKYRFLYPNGLFKGAPKIELKKGVVGINELFKKIVSKGNFNLILGVNNTIIIKQRGRSQSKKVSGRVTDQENNPLPGVTVAIKGLSLIHI